MAPLSKIQWMKPLKTDVKIIDFGGATFQKDHHTSLIQTRQYRAPEVILTCKNYGQPADIFSLGLVLVEMIYCSDKYNQD